MTDMITLHYDGKSGFMVSDCMSIQYDVKTDKMWDGLIGTEDPMLGTTSSITAVASTDPLLPYYKTVLKWDCFKKFNVADKYDWSGYSAWFLNQSAKVSIIGSWGYPLPNGMLKVHESRSPQTLTMVDGSGLAEVKASTTPIQTVNSNLLRVSSLIIFIFI